MAEDREKFRDAMVEIGLEVPGAVIAHSLDEAFQLLNQHFLPNRVLALIDPSDPNAGDIQKQLPLLAGKLLQNDKPAAYVCENFACKKPVNTAPELKSQLGL